MKNYVKVSFIFGFFFLFLSCSEEIDKGLHGDVKDLGIRISIVSPNGENLLDPENSAVINEEEIRVYHLVDGERKEVFDPMMDSPRGFKIYHNNDRKYVFFIGGIAVDLERGETLIQWTDEDIDTLNYEIEIKNNGGYQSITKVWFNGEEVWNRKTGNDKRQFEIVKTLK